MPISNPSEPFSKNDLQLALAEANGEVADFFSGMSAQIFFERFDEAWSPAENLLHLIKSVNPVATALKLPKWFLKLLFGVPARPSRTLPQIRDDYRRVLAQGGKASGRFIPILKTGHADQAEWQRDLLQKWHAAGQRLLSALVDWHESHLDQMQLPHPLLGKLTIREMIFFTLYHNLHHVNNVRQRLGRETSAIP